MSYGVSEDDFVVFRDENTGVYHIGWRTSARHMVYVDMNRKFNTADAATNAITRKVAMERG